MSTQAPRIAKTLINLDLVPAEEITPIANQTQRTDEFLKEVFQKELISSKQLSKELSSRFGSPLFDLFAIDPEMVPKDLIEPKIVERHLAVPIYKHGKNVFVAMIDPTNRSAIDEIKFFTGLQVTPIQVELDALESLLTSLEEEDSTALDDFLGDGEVELEAADEDSDKGPESEEQANEAPIVKYVNKILVDAINRGASDIHIEPFEKELRIRFRVDGILYKVTSQPISFASRIVARIKILAKLDIAERRAPQDGRVKLKVSKNKAFDFRVNTLPTVHGEKVVMRLLDSSAANLDLNILGFSETQLETYVKTAARPYGMILITGPTGSGKTVTLYSALNMLNDPTKNISTVEDPVEIQLPGITQVNINEKANLTFAEALKAFLRQDPDILMLGEIRDLETAEIAIKAAQTGHMVFSTLHTNDAPSTLTRMLNMGVPAFNVASAVELIVAQRLVRKLCTACRVPAELPEKVLIEAGFEEAELGELNLFQANIKGCPSCSSGYKGRAGVFQVMPISEAIRTIIMEGGTEQDIEKQALSEGITDLRQSGLLKVKDGVTSLEEIERVTNV
ncbi:type IV-A pilus assembly ATPase PilB [Arenicella sp. 4NH20-0111]|uniref:type IV-A pilus assembly ATPase PilB n=1 Tax=Arenicella sp. 4NH20-0111 TaxID=3127648 RepID=UPI00310A8C80